MEWIEVSPLPLVCQECEELDCWECDNAGERLQKQIAEIDRQLSSISAGPVISKNTETETEV